MSKKVSLVLSVLGILFIVLISIYSYNRNRIINYNSSCSGTEFCVLKIVPRSILEVITDRPGSISPSVVPARFGPRNDISYNQSTTTTSRDIFSWKVFENTKYFYFISHPLSVHILTSNVYASNLNDASDVTFSIPGKFTLVGIEALLPLRVELQSEYESASLDRKKIFDAHDEILLRNLKDYATALRDLQLNDPNPYMKNRSVGQIEEITITGKKAYKFSVDKGFISSPLGWGYALGDNLTYTFVVTENAKKQKIILYYLTGNPIAEKMFHSFEYK